MNVTFTTAHKMMRKMVREFAEKEVAPLDPVMDRTQNFPYELFDKMRALGFMGIIVPREYGGSGGDCVTSVITLIELAKASASVAITMDAHWFATDAIMHFGTEEQRRKYLPRISAGSICSFSITEPGCGTDAAGVLTTAVADGDEYVLNGAKSWCTNAEASDIFIIMAKTDKGKGVKGISAFIVEKGTPGFVVGAKESKLGVRGSVQNDLILTDCRVKKDALLGKENGGFKIAMQGLDGARISITAIGVGLCERAIKISREYARERRAFGNRLADFQAIQHMIADMAVGLEASTLMVYDVASMKDARMRFTKEAAMAKIMSSSHAVKCGLDCIQILGGGGYSTENPAERILRDAKILEIGEGTTQALKMIVGKAELEV